MKISKEQLIKLFKDSIANISIHSGQELSLSNDYNGDREIVMSYHITEDHMLLGTMFLVAISNPNKCFHKIEEMKDGQTFGMKYFISFKPYHNNMMKITSEQEERREVEIRHELSNDEFIVLSKIFKKKFDEAEKFFMDSVHT